MPIYEYICSKCWYEFERLLTLSKRLEPETEPCERCGEMGIKQIPSIPAAHRVE